MNPWTRIAAIFSVLASLVTIYNVAVRPKDAPPIWNSIVAAVSGGSKTTNAARNCARVRKPVWPEGSWSVRVAPGTEHKEIARLTPGDRVEIVEETGPWVRIREEQGLGASLQGWAPARAIEKAACGKA
jgi:Bacterial SH3 domain